MKKFWVLFSLFVLGLLAGPAMALTVQNTMIDWHIFNGDSASAIYTIADEPSDFSDVTLFCPLDAMDTTNNVTPCYYEGSIVNATIYFNETTEYPKLVSGKIGNAFEFDATESRVVISATLDGTVFSVVVWAYPTDLSVNRQIVQGYPRFGIFLKSGGLGVYVHYKDTANTWHTLLVPYTIQTNTWYMITAIYECDVTSNKTTITLYVNDELAGTVTGDGVPQDLQKIVIASDIGLTTPFVGTIDEVRFYDGKKLSEDEIKVLYLIGRKKLSEPANLTVSSVTYDSTANKFDITINASLPAGAQYLYVPADAIVSAPVVQNWSTGHKLIDVSGKNSVLITIPATVGATMPGLRGLAIETDEGIYAYGTGKLNLATLLSTPLAKPSLITNTIQDGKVVAINWSGIDTFSKLQPSSYISSVSGSANLTILQDGDKLMKLNLDAPLKLYFQNLLPIMDYKVSDGQSEIGSFKTDTLGTASYTAPAGTIYIGTPENIQQVMSNNLINLLTKILIIALMAGVFVEMTKTKMDDEMVAAIIALLVVLVIIAIIHYL